MKREHNFTTPRNLFEKLLRDSERFDVEPNGDNFFNFTVTAYHLTEWIKKAPISSHETTKRMLHKIFHHPLMKKCCGIIEGDSTFVFEIDDEKHSAVLKLKEETFNPFKVKNEILDLFKDYFQVK